MPPRAAIGLRAAAAAIMLLAACLPDGRGERYVTRVGDTPPPPATATATAAPPATDDGAACDPAARLCR
jgi:hypothetical protein